MAESSASVGDAHLNVKIKRKSPAPNEKQHTNKHTHTHKYVGSNSEVVIYTQHTQKQLRWILSNPINLDIET